MNGPLRCVAMVSLLIYPCLSYGEPALSRVVSYSEASMLLRDKTLRNRRIELVSDKGVVIQGKLAGFSGGAVQLTQHNKAAPAAPLCEIVLIRLSRKVAGPFRRFAGIVGGFSTGALLGGMLLLGSGMNGSEAAGMALFYTFPAAGAWAGSKLVSQREDTVYLIDPAPCQSYQPTGLPLFCSSSHFCSGAK